jgi:hypothetical protein
LGEREFPREEVGVVAVDGIADDKNVEVEEMTEASVVEVGMEEAKVENAEDTESNPEKEEAVVEGDDSTDVGDCEDSTDVEEGRTDDDVEDGSSTEVDEANVEAIETGEEKVESIEDEESDSEDGEATVDDGDSTDVGGCEDSTDVDEAGVDDDGSTEVEEAISDEVAAVVREMVVVDCGTGVPEDCATTVVVEGAEGDGDADETASTSVELATALVSTA